jgi:hypothetical protein
MTKLKKLGIIIIIVGVFIPSILYPFTSYTSSASLMQVVFATKGIVYQPGFRDLEVVLKGGHWIREGDYKGHYEGRIAIPYHYTLAVGITIAFLGIALVTLTGKKNKKNVEKG